MTPGSDKPARRSARARRRRLSPGVWTEYRKAQQRRLQARLEANRQAEASVAQLVADAQSAAEERAHHGTMVPRPLAVGAAWSWRILVIAAAGLAGFYLLAKFSMVAISLAVALLLAVLLEPLSRWTRRFLHFPPAACAATSVIFLVTFVTGLLYLAGRSIFDGFEDLWERVLEGKDQLFDWLHEGPLQLSETDLEEFAAKIGTTAKDNSSALFGGVMEVTASATQLFAGMILCLFAVFFFIKDGRDIWRWVVRLLPWEARLPIHEAGIRAWVTLGAYARTQMIVAAIDAIGIGLVAALLKVPLWIPIAIIVFLGSFIPIVGAIVSGAIAVVVALVVQGPFIALLMFIGVLAVQQIESNLLQPWLQGNAVSLHPLAVVVAVAAGSTLAGIVGALFAVPVVAVINTIILYLTNHDRYPELAEDVNRPGGPPGSLHEDIAQSYAHYLPAKIFSADAGGDTDAASAAGSGGGRSGGGARSGRGGRSEGGARSGGAGGAGAPGTGSGSVEDNPQVRGCWGLEDGGESASEDPPSPGTA